MLSLSVQVKCICQHYFKYQNVEVDDHFNYIKCPDQPLASFGLKCVLLCTATFIPNTFEGGRVKGSQLPFLQLKCMNEKQKPHPLEWSSSIISFFCIPVGCTKENLKNSFFCLEVFKVHASYSYKDNYFWFLEIWG